MKIRLNSLIVIAGLSISGWGCGGEQYPDAPPGVNSRALMENPLGVAEAAKNAKNAKKSTAKAEAANKEAALKNDPRGK